MDTNDEKQKSAKTQQYIKISIVIVSIISILVLVLLFYFMYKESLSIKIYIDDVQYRVTEEPLEQDGEQYRLGKITYKSNNKDVVKDIIIIDKDNKVYFSIHTMADIQKYSYTLGELNSNSQDINKCHVACDGEDVSFAANSKEIYKYIKPIQNSITSEVPQSDTEQYENFTLADEVKMFKGELYATADSISIAFNSSISSPSSTELRVYSLSYLMKQNAQVLSNAGYASSAVYRNQRSMIKGRPIVSKAADASSQGALYGIYSLNNNSNVTDMRYQTIEYLQNIDKYIVSSDGKYGLIEVVENDGKPIAKEVIPLEYDSISLLDEKNGLFIIKKLDSFGVLKDDGTMVVPTEFTSIGIPDTSIFSKQRITNKYLLFGECIPVERDGSYGMYNINGDKIVDPHYAGFGCDTAQEIVGTGDNVLIIPEEAGLGFNGIVIKTSSTGKYGVLASSGAMKMTAIYDSIYSVMRDNTTQYYAVINGSEPKLLTDLLEPFF